MYNCNEELIRKVTKIVAEMLAEEEIRIPIGISNRHVHISQDDLALLFGENYHLTKFKDLKQPGQFASGETVTIKGPKGTIEKVRILGPVRANTQVEISLTDGFKLGIEAPVRESGKINATPGIEIIGPKGSIKKSEGAIAALRHIHMPVSISKMMNLKDKDLVDVEIRGIRGGVLGNVLVRVSDSFKLEMHVDMDEANSCALKNGDTVKILKSKK